MLKIAQISDPHIDVNDKNNQIIQDHFKQVIQSIQNYEADVIIITGDLGFPVANKESYLYQKEILKTTGIPYFITPGNHDDLGLLIDVFNRKEMPPVVITNGAVAQKGEVLFFVDTANARMDIKQQNWLKRELDLHDSNPVIFTHYPLLSRGKSYVDVKYPFKTEQIFKSCLPENKISYIFSGHYHRGEKREDGNLINYITPATSICIANEESFILEENKFGWRYIEMEKNEIKTGAVFEELSK